MEDLLNQTFPTWKEASDACDTVARAQGYALSIATKKPNASKPRYIHLRCSKGRAYLSRAEPGLIKRRNTNTQMTQCPFRLSIKFLDASRSWKIKTAGQPHNHNMTALATTHTKYRTQILETHREDIIRMCENGVRPSIIAAQLRDREDDPDLAGITPKAIHNLIARHRRDQLAGRSSASRDQTDDATREPDPFE